MHGSSHPWLPGQAREIEAHAWWRATSIGFVRTLHLRSYGIQSKIYVFTNQTVLLHGGG